MLGSGLEASSSSPARQSGSIGDNEANRQHSGTVKSRSQHLERTSVF